MSIDPTPSSSVRAVLSTRNKVGLVLAGLLAVVDLPGAFLAGDPGPGVVGPPFAVLVAGSVLGVVTLVAVVHTWRTRSRGGARIVAGARILSAATALPAFFVEGVPPVVVALAAAFVVATVVVVGLVLARPDAV